MRVRVGRRTFREDVRVRVRHIETFVEAVHEKVFVGFAQFGESAVEG